LTSHCERCATRTLQIAGRGPEAVRIVIEHPKAEIAFVAKQTANLVEQMTMVDAEGAILPADRTDATLQRQECVVIIPGESVATRAIALLSFFSVFRVG
jgi:hypothetical protein